MAEDMLKFYSLNLYSLTSYCRGVGENWRETQWAGNVAFDLFDHILMSWNGKGHCWEKLLVLLAEILQISSLFE